MSPITRCLIVIKWFSTRLCLCFLLHEGGIDLEAFNLIQSTFLLKKDKHKNAVYVKTKENCCILVSYLCWVGNIYKIQPIHEEQVSCTYCILYIVHIACVFRCFVFIKKQQFCSSLLVYFTAKIIFSSFKAFKIIL